MKRNGIIKKFDHDYKYTMYSDRLYNKADQFEQNVTLTLTRLVEEFGCLSIKVHEGLTLVAFKYDNGCRLVSYCEYKPLGHFDHANIMLACRKIADYAIDNDLYYKAA